MSATVQASGSVLVGVDGSVHNASAVAWAAAEALSSSATLVLVHDDGGAGGAAARATLDRAAAGALEVDRHLRVVARLAGEAGPADGLVRTAREEQRRVDDHGAPGDEPVVVVGRRGSGGFREMTLGSTARGLVHQPDAPATVIVPSGWDPASVDDDSPVVVEAVSERALAVAAARAARLGRRLVAVSTWSVPADAAMAGVPIPTVWSEHATRAERGLQQTLQAWQAAYPGLEVVAVTTDRHPAAALLDQADRAELLVVARGSTAATVVEHARCPVAVV